MYGIKPFVVYSELVRSLNKSLFAPCEYKNATCGQMFATCERTSAHCEQRSENEKRASSVDGSMQENQSEGGGLTAFSRTDTKKARRKFRRASVLRMG